jgi:glycosyltransferase involved in cell wall biosynthesis
MNTKEALSLILITKNEEKDLEKCLLSVKNLVNEIILVDSGSTDKTIEIARKYTDKIFHRKWDGFASQKQFAMDKATGPWVLNLDADECATPDLVEEIRGVLNTPAETTGVNGFNVPFRHFFLGRQLKFGGVGGEKHIRLFRKQAARYGTKKIHEGISVDSPIKDLKNSIDHISYRDVQEYLQKCNFYTSLIATEKYQQGKRFHFWHHLRLPWEFVSRYVLKLGFLDGQEGFIYALLSSYYVWLKFLKLKDLEKNSLEEI